MVELTNVGFHHLYTRSLRIYFETHVLRYGSEGNMFFRISKTLNKLEIIE